MKINGEIIVIEDDQDDRDFLKDIFESLGYPNKVVFFKDPATVEEYLANPNVKPFMILSDINMPKMDGYELRDQLLANTDINEKCVPYIFLSTSKNPENVLNAYKRPIQGYFKKEDDYAIYKQTIQGIIEYWQTSLTPLNAG